jgi:Lrp/AsnC family transcriptional regulator, regulator for asnA, asnC and gidA
MLDGLDRGILQLLHQNGRMPYSAMAKALKSNEATVRKRVDRLVRQGVVEIIGVSNPYRLGLETHVMIGMEVDLGALDAVADELASMEEFSYVACASGGYDIVAVAVFTSDAELYQFLSQRLAKVKGIRATHTSHLLRLMRRTFNYRIPDTSEANPKESESPFGWSRSTSSSESTR